MLDSAVKRWMEEGNRLFYDSKFLGAVLYYDKVIEKDRTHLSAWLNKGASLVNLGKIEAALVCYDKVLEIDPNDIAALVSKGSIMFNLGKLKDAILYYDKALEMDPENTWILINKFEALTKLGLLDEAKSIQNSVRDINENKSRILIKNGDLQFQSGKFDEAMRNFKDAAELSPEETRKWLKEWLNDTNAMRISQASSSKNREKTSTLLSFAKVFENYSKTSLAIIRSALMLSEKPRKTTSKEFEPPSFIEIFEKEFVRNYPDDGYSTKCFEQVHQLLTIAFKTHNKIDEASSDMSNFWSRLGEINNSISPMADLANELYSNPNRSKDDSMIMFHLYCYTYMVKYETLLFDIIKNLSFFSKTSMHGLERYQNPKNEDIKKDALRNIRLSGDQFFGIEPVFLEPAILQEKTDIRNAIAYGQTHFDPEKMMIQFKCQKIDEENEKIAYKTISSDFNEFVKKCLDLSDTVNAFKYISMIITIEKLLTDNVHKKF